MKTRIALGLLASLVVLTAASPDADAATKKRGAKGQTKPAALVVTAPANKAPAATSTASTTKVKTAATSTASTTKVKPAKKTKAARKATPATVPASTTVPASLASAVVSLEQASASATTTTTTATVPATPAKASRFLASGVPLAEVRDGRLAAVGTSKLPCGTKARWAKGKSRWHALDAWGRVTGTLTVGGSDKYDGSGCHQVRFTEGTGRDGLGVFVAAGSGYAAGATAEWKAEGDVAKRFESLYAAQESAWVDGKVDRAEKAAGQERHRTVFFELPKQEGSVEGAAKERRPTRWAVAGGRVLVVGYVGAGGAWKVGHVLPPTGKHHAYEPLAIFDMNGDGLPEIVVHEEAGGVYVDRVLSFDAGTMRWENAVASPGGATR